MVQKVQKMRFWEKSWHRKTQYRDVSQNTIFLHFESLIIGKKRHFVQKKREKCEKMDKKWVFVSLVFLKIFSKTAPNREVLFLPFSWRNTTLKNADFCQFWWPLEHDLWFLIPFFSWYSREKVQNLRFSEKCFVSAIKRK